MEITAITEQLVQPNQDVVFTSTPVKGGCSIIHRDGSGLVKLRGACASQCRARFKVTFSGNIAIPTGGTAPQEMSLALSVDGEPLGTTMMAVTPPVVNRYFNVSSAVYLDVPKCCCSTIGVRNTSEEEVLVRNANMIVERVA